MFDLKYCLLCLLVPLASAVLPKNDIDVPNTSINVPQAQTLTDQLVAAPVKPNTVSTPEIGVPPDTAKVGSTVLEERVANLERRLDEMERQRVSSSGGSTGSNYVTRWGSSVPQAQTYSTVSGGSTGSVSSGGSTGSYRASSRYTAPAVSSTYLSTPEIILAPGEVLVGDPVIVETTTVQSTPPVRSYGMVTESVSSDNCYYDALGRRVCPTSASATRNEPFRLFAPRTWRNR